MTNIFSRNSLIFGLLCVATGAASAADLAPVYKAPPTASVYNWSGFYIGGNIGYGWGNNTGGLWDSLTDSPIFNVGIYFADGGNVLPGVKPSGLLGGGQIGFNWQTSSPWVFGVVADLQAANMQASATNSIAPAAGGSLSAQSNEAKIDWFGTARGKVGYAANNWLFYGTGGLAYGQVQSNLSLDCVNCIPRTVWAGSASKTKIGWAVGAGVEVGLTQNWTLGVEYLHFDLGSISATASFVSGFESPVTFTADSKFAADIVRGTINYRF